MTVEIPISLEKIQNAIHDWFSSSTGLQVVWQNQNAPAPEGSYGSLNMIVGPTSRGGVAELRETYDARRALGAEVELEVAMECSLTVSCQVFVKGTDGANPSCNAMSYCVRAQMALELSTFIDGLNAANVSVSSVSGPKNLPALLGTEWESRAGIDITFNSMLSLREFIGYIEKVHAVSTQLEIDKIFWVGGTV
jgi:hypothetical protein